MAKYKDLTLNNKKRLCLALIILDQAQKKKQRKTWTRSWLLNRESFGCYNNLMSELKLKDAEAYRRWIRMDTASFEYLLELVTPFISKLNTRMREAIPPGERLALTLRYLATGETQSSLCFQFRIAQNTISGILPVVCEAIYNCLRGDFLTTPHTAADWKNIASKFQDMWNFPMCLGAMDGKHIQIIPPPGSGAKYFNYKGDFSVVLLALVDAELNFTYVDVGTNGRISDGGVWGKSSLKKAMEDNSLNIPIANVLPGTNIPVPYVIVADDAFPLSDYIMKPFPGKNLEVEKRIFNYRLSRARRIVENAFGILAARFQIYKCSIPTSVNNVKKIVLATCALHNFLKGTSTYISPGSTDRENIVQHTVEEGDWRQYNNNMIPFRRTGAKSSDTAKEIRHRFLNYFNSIGAVPWQEEMCNLH